MGRNISPSPTVCQMCYKNSLTAVVGRDNSRVAQGWGWSGGSHGKVGFEVT